MHKNSFTLSWVLQVLTPRMSQIFLGKIILQKMAPGVDKVVNFTDFSRPKNEIKNFSREDLNRIEGLFKTTSTI